MWASFEIAIFAAMEKPYILSIFFTESFHEKLMMAEDECAFFRQVFFVIGKRDKAVFLMK